MRISDWSSDVCSSDLSYLSRIALSTDSGHGLKLCIEKDIYGRRGENAARRQGRAAVACLVRQSGPSGYDGTLSRTLSELWFPHRRIAVATADHRYRPARPIGRASCRASGCKYG